MRAILLLTVTILLSPVQSLEPQSVYTEQPDAPVEVTFYTARYRDRSPDRPEGIHHQAGYQNRTDRQIVAVQLGFVSFSVFNEFVDHTKGVAVSDIEPGEEGTGLWVAQFGRADFAFHTGVVYVDRVRFENGEIWVADRGPILDQLRQVQADFDAAVLDEGAEG